MRHSNVVVNLIGKQYQTYNFKFRDVNVDGARRIARIAREEGVDRLVHISSMNAKENPDVRPARNPYCTRCCTQISNSFRNSLPPTDLNG